MRTALLTTSWPRFAGDPSGHFVEAEARALTRCGEEVVVLAAEGDAFGWPGFAARVKEDPRRLVGAAAWAVRARRKLAVERFDRVVAHWAVPCAWPIATDQPAPLEVVSHGGDVRLLGRVPEAWRAAVVKAIVAKARPWRFVSSALLEELCARLPARIARAVERVAEVRPCVLDVPPPAREAIEEKRTRVGGPFAVCAARLVPSKRVDVAIAWARARGTPLVVVGDGPERAALEALARSIAGAAPPVHFVGRTSRPDTLAWIAASAELLQPSRREGCSTVVREAEALGVPVRAL